MKFALNCVAAGAIFAFAGPLLAQTAPPKPASKPAAVTPAAKAAPAAATASATNDGSGGCQPRRSTDPPNDDPIE